MGRLERQQVLEEVFSHDLAGDHETFVVEGMKLAQQVYQRLMLSFRDQFNAQRVLLQASV